MELVVIHREAKCFVRIVNSFQHLRDFGQVHVISISVNSSPFEPARLLEQNHVKGRVWERRIYESIAIPQDVLHEHLTLSIWSEIPILHCCSVKRCSLKCVRWNFILNRISLSLIAYHYETTQLLVFLIEFKINKNYLREKIIQGGLLGLLIFYRSHYKRRLERSRRNLKRTLCCIVNVKNNKRQE